MEKGKIEKKKPEAKPKEFIEIFAHANKGGWEKFAEIEVTPALKKKFRTPFIIKYKKSVLQEK